MLEYANRAIAASKAIPVQSPTQTASLLISVADAHRLLNHIREAEQHYSAAFDALNRAGVSEGWEAADLLTNWAAFTTGTGQQLKALALTEKAMSIASGNVGEENLHPSLLLTYCRTLTTLNRLDEAWAATERAQERAKTVGNRQVQALAEQTLSRIAMLQGKFPEAWQHADKFGELVGVVPPNSFPALAVQFSRARIQQAQGLTNEALATLDGIRQQLDILSAKMGRNQGVLPMVWQNWLEMHSELIGIAGQTKAAITEAQEAIRIARSLQSKGAASADTGTSLLVLAQLQLASSDRLTAANTASDAEAMMEKALGPNHPKTVKAREVVQVAKAKTLP
jgi:tetratricopeptide (TPR) repeat protein